MKNLKKLSRQNLKQVKAGAEGDQCQVDSDCPNGCYTCEHWAIHNVCLFHRTPLCTGIFGK